MPHIVDGFVIPIPAKKVAAYRAMAKRACKVWLEHGALDFNESLLDSKKPEFGPGLLRGIKAKRNETVLFSWITYKSRADRKRILAAVMKDPRLQADMDPKKMPFDTKRMLCDRFKIIVSK